MAVRLRRAIALTAGAFAFALACLLVSQQSARATSYGSSAIVQRNGYPVFTVDGKPFFVYGAAFFYERLPPSLWERSLDSYRALGINTLDLYVPWNWHELTDGDFDFSGRTSPRRDLHRVMELARKIGFKIILRPGPVIRNEWRNGGYPAWLLERPEYGMPLHDLLEGRYPPTATLQNAHSDDAAAEWMRNATHIRYAKRWLERVLHEFEPVADLVIAVQLDDDQGAYIDNQTWPAPHLRAYLEWLRDVVHGVTGRAVPVFINTYEMKVTASSPVWAWGNWYQSDAYSIGEHDRAQLEFDTGLLRTQPRVPLMLSEFQAGWLEQPDDIRPRPADPANTLLAMSSLIAMGVRGIVNFPAQDTLYPAGMEAPFANAFYAWDAALPLDTAHQMTDGRYAPTARIGRLVSLFGSSLAGAAVVPDAAIAYLTSAYDERSLSNDAIGEIGQRTLETQRGCRAQSLTCRLVDLRFIDDGGLLRYPILFVPRMRTGELAHRAFIAPVIARLARFARRGGVVVNVDEGLDPQSVARALRAARHERVVESAPGATFARSSDGVAAGYLVIPNYGDAALTYRGLHVTVSPGHVVRIPELIVPPRDAVISPIGLNLGAVGRAPTASGRVEYTDCQTWLLDGDRGIAFSTLQNTVGCRFAYSLASRETIVGVPASASEFGMRVTRDGSIRSGPLVAPKPHVDGFFAAGGSWIAAEGVPLRRDVLLGGATAPVFGAPTPTPDGVSVAYRSDVYQDVSDAVVLENALVRLIVSPVAGGRAFVFEDKTKRRSIFTTVGAMRDDVKIEPSLSTTDRIAKYTHQFPAGTFNRPYQATIVESGKRAVVRLTYDAPDVVPHGAYFERLITLEPNARSFTVDETVTFRGTPQETADQRAVSVTSLAVGDSRSMKTVMTLASNAAPFVAGTSLLVSGDALGYYDTATGELATVAWHDGDVADARLLERQYSVVSRLTLAPGRTARTIYGYVSAGSIDEAKAAVASAGTAAQGRSARSANGT
jgi:hypothetical protein